MPRNYRRSGNSRRNATLVPWYHVPKPRCTTTTLNQTQCTYSASYETADGRIQACKIHYDMLVIEGVKIRRIKTKVVDIRIERPDLHIVRTMPSFRSAAD